MMAVRKSLLLKLARLIAWIYQLLPFRLRETLIFGQFVLESRTGDPASALRRLFTLQDRLDLVINERAVAYGNGEHPKHRLIAYHGFFVERTPVGSRVLDIGCGYGAVARSIAQRVPGVEVTGIDLDRPRLSQAMTAANPQNLTFVLGDVLKDLPSGHWDVIVLSNILEHIDQRVDFLKSVVAKTSAGKLLIRVPLFERQWQNPMRAELGINYFSDSTHYIEHTLEQFEEEITAAGLKPVEIVLRWGEIWADCRP
jgi:2-polyprenyl-3-methyl-5-hydroxy-6-metoxy-1,4-benzoquinol methylase